MTVIELAPGGGWYTEILAPFLYAYGHLIEAASPPRKAGGSSFEKKLGADSKVYGHIEKVVPFSPPTQVDLGPSGSADMVLSFRNTHDWLNQSPKTLAAVFKGHIRRAETGRCVWRSRTPCQAVREALDSSRQLHRVPEDYLIELGLKTGFQLAGVSEINANPKDPENVNVHRLPPDLTGPDSERGEDESHRRIESHDLEVRQTLISAAAASMALQACNGWRHLSPSKRLKSRSAVIHSQPFSIAIAARNASATRLPLAPEASHKLANISQ